MRNVANLRACSTRIIIRNPCPNKKFDFSSINSSLVTSPVAFTIGHLFTEERKLNSEYTDPNDLKPTVVLITRHEIIVSIVQWSIVVCGW